ncbi:hypothetical protein [Actinomadura miaoliensis]|uniref:hypothetical protein n=1 Tax=Actinomadura miaoliensis TaxID=430685 RepID=UPI0031ECDCDB
MSVVRREARRRWFVVAGLATMLGATPFAVAAYPAESGGPGTAGLRRLIQGSAGLPYEGLVESHGSLGLPRLPGLEDVTGLLGGTSRMRAWYDGPRRWRIALLTATGERDYLRSGHQTATWDYERDLLVRATGRPAVQLPGAADLMPPDLARRLLRLAAPGDRVTALPARRVAGRSASGLRVVPADRDTTVGHVDVWADPRSGLAVEVRVTARDTGRTALHTRFLDLRQRRPAASAVAPRPAPGVATAQVDTLDLLARLASRTAESLPPRLAGRPVLDSTPSVAAVRAYDGGFSSLVVAPLPGRYGRRVFETAESAGAGRVDVGPGADALMVRSSVATAMLLRPYADVRTFLLVGAVRPELLRDAARELGA